MPLRISNDFGQTVNIVSIEEVRVHRLINQHFINRNNNNNTFKKPSALTIVHTLNSWQILSSAFDGQWSAK